MNRKSHGRTGNDRRGTGNNRDSTVAPPDPFRPRQSYDIAIYQCASANNSYANNVVSFNPVDYVNKWRKLNSSLQTLI
ncbi:hypothetical protein DPMN_177428 [Dreissena polymorpha]|uniref:Uncharacterized protein n=1 Tax=Dreissena polymorpha TaxID=45954 RepID=A0A9D4IKJ2_DREPO|nr:hypothetical protein DPMN_177428 [Dreissena polymorpha]